MRSTNYVKAVQLDNHNIEALTGAGETAFELGEYAKAAHYSRARWRVEHESPNARRRLSLAETILAEDPLAPHLTAKERQRRLLLDYERSIRRIEKLV